MNDNSRQRAEGTELDVHGTRRLIVPGTVLYLPPGWMCNGSGASCPGAVSVYDSSPSHTHSDDMARQFSIDLQSTYRQQELSSLSLYDEFLPFCPQRLCVSFYASDGALLAKCFCAHLKLESWSESRFFFGGTPKECLLSFLWFLGIPEEDCTTCVIFFIWLPSQDIQLAWNPSWITHPAGVSSCCICCQLSFSISSHKLQRRVNKVKMHFAILSSQKGLFGLLKSYVSIGFANERTKDELHSKVRFFAAQPNCSTFEMFLHQDGGLASCLHWTVFGPPSNA